MDKATVQDITPLSISRPAHVTGSFSLWLPYPTSVNRLWRSARNKKTGKPFVYPSGEYKAWIAEAHVAWLQQRSKLFVKRVDGRYILWMEARSPDARQRDVGNLEKAVSDFLQMEGIIANDHLAKQIVLDWSDDEGASVGIIITLYPYT